MSSTRRRLSSAAALAAAPAQALPCAALLLAGETPDARPARRAAVVAAATASRLEVADEPPVRAAAPAVPTALGLRAGDVLEYAVAYDARLALGGQEALRAVVAGRRVLTVHRAGPDGLLLGERLVCSEARVGDAGSPHDVSAALATELLVRVDPRGRVLAVALPPVAPAARDLLRGLVTAWSVELPTAPAARWEVAGRDGAAATTDRYELRPDGGALRVARRRTRSGFEGGGQASLTLGADGALLALEGADAERAAADAHGVEVALAATLRLELVARGWLEADRLPAVEAGLAWTEGPGAWNAADATAGPRPPTRPAALVLADVAREFAPAGGDLAAPVGPDATRAFLELTDLVERDEAALDQVVAFARDPRRPLAARATAIDALGGAGTPAAQGALVTLAGDAALDLRLAPNVFLALGEARAPRAEVVDLLVATAAGAPGERARWAAAGAGALAGRAPAPVADRVAGELERTLGADPVSDQALLGALGQAGRERSRPAIESYLDAEEPALRAAAVAALRSIDGTDATLAAAVARDPSPAVRAEAVRSLKGRPAARGTLVAALGDRAVAVRLEAIGALGALGERDALEVAATTDPVPDVRDAAAGALRDGRDF